MSKYTLIFLIQPEVNNNSKIVLLKRFNNPAKDTFTGIGGHIEQNENPIQCAIRETEEESGIVTNKINIIGYYDKINSYIGYRLFKNLTDCFLLNKEIKTDEGMLGLYNLNSIYKLNMTDESIKALDYVLKYLKSKGKDLSK